LQTGLDSPKQIEKSQQITLPANKSKNSFPARSEGISWFVRHELGVPPLLPKSVTDLATIGSDKMRREARPISARGWNIFQNFD
jgi:hypothetical protein